MSSYKPTRFDEGVNTTHTNYLGELAKLLGLSIALVLAVSFALSLLVDLMVPHISVETERWLLSAMTQGMEGAGAFPEEEERLEAMIAALPPGVRPAGYDPIRVHIVDETVINAFALPGGHIVVTTGLLCTLESENALAFVLGHEMGHFAARDHLRGLGRGLAIAHISAALLGQDSGMTSAVTGTLGMTDLAYSRSQERAADDWGVRVLMVRYGHIGGAGELFDVLAREEAGAGLTLPAILSTHPGTAARTAYIRGLAESGAYPVNDTQPWRWEHDEQRCRGD